jgi:hypothetical protein
MSHKRRPTTRTLVALATSAAATLVVTIGSGAAYATSQPPAAASTDVAPNTSSTTHYSKIGTPPSSVVDAKWCSSDADWAHACFQRHGDTIWVDNNAGEHVKAHWENWLRNADGTWVFYRDGDCISMNWGWGYCDENFYEDSSLNAVGGYGSGIRLYTCYGECDRNYQWVRNNS